MTLSDPESALRQIIERMRLTQERHIDKSFEGIGVSVPGRVRPETQGFFLRLSFIGAISTSRPL
jgi:hypothetical protein